MCVIAYKERGEFLTYADFVAMFNTNPDGMGYAVKKDGRWKMEKGIFDIDEGWNRIKEYALDETVELIVHFRIATHGNIDSMNTHPFLISRKETSSVLKHTLGRGEALLFHNGIIDIDAERRYGVVVYINGKKSAKETPQVKSDTWKFAELLSSILRITNSLSETLLIGKKLFDIYGNGSRIIIAANDKIELWGNWCRVNGIYVSNKYWNDYWEIQANLKTKKQNYTYNIYNYDYAYDYTYTYSMYDDDYSIPDEDDHYRTPQTPDEPQTLDEPIWTAQRKKKKRRKKSRGGERR